MVKNEKKIVQTLNRKKSFKGVFRKNPFVSK